MAKTTDIEKAMHQFAATETSPGEWDIQRGGRCHRFVFRDDDVIYGSASVPAESIGDVCRFVHLSMEESHREGDAPPEQLKGNGPGGFEELLMTEAVRLERSGYLTMGRYPVASVMMEGSPFPVQKPSLPDFEGVFSDGRQFIIEAKVCSSPSFKIDKAHLKPKQISHMLTRHQFGVPGILLVHFNARVGKTFYDPAVTFGIHVRPQDAGGPPLWESFVKGKGAAAGSLDRATVAALGVEMTWHTPKQCRSPRPDIAKFFQDFRESSSWPRHT